MALADVGDAVAPVLLEATGRSAAELVALVRLFVSPRFRRRGLASALLDHAVAAARADGFRCVLDVAVDDHAAIALYERHGWHRVGTGTAPWLDASGAHPAIVLFVAPAP